MTSDIAPAPWMIVLLALAGWSCGGKPAEFEDFGDWETVYTLESVDDSPLPYEDPSGHMPPLWESTLQLAPDRICRRSYVGDDEQEQYRCGHWIWDRTYDGRRELLEGAYTTARKHSNSSRQFPMIELDCCEKEGGERLSLEVDAAGLLLLDGRTVYRFVRSDDP